MGNKLMRNECTYIEYFKHQSPYDMWVSITLMRCAFIGKYNSPKAAVNYDANTLRCLSYSIQQQVAIPLRRTTHQSLHSKS
mmetsp:Transcript_27111/g.65140  ORF Transcript_27111/g.65140 Transcript_27111/m.65140 type:complete len:81 (-) Transcript_27111:71-313(-)